MKSLWLSTQELTPLGIRALPTAHPDTIELIDGLHVDVYARDSVAEAISRVALLAGLWPDVPYDLHFIDSHSKALRIVRGCTAAHSAPRIVWAPFPFAKQGWHPSWTASDLANHGNTFDFRDLERVLITAPPSTRDHTYRVRILTEAVGRVRASASPQCRIAIDRDILDTFATAELRAGVTEVIIGKRILRNFDQVTSTQEVIRIWSQI